MGRLSETTHTERINAYGRWNQTLEAHGVPQRCDWCGSGEKKMVMMAHSSGRILNLCFHGCQWFPEPYKQTGLTDDWERVDPFRAPPRSAPRYGGGHDWREQ